MKKYFVFVTIAAFLLSCNDEQSVTISGAYPDGAGQMMTLELLNVNQLMVIDSVEVKNSGKFKINIDLKNPELILVKNEIGQVINLLPHPGENITLDINCAEYATCYSVQGSKESEDIRSLVLKVEDTKTKLDSIITLLNQTEDADISESLAKEYSEIFEAQRMHSTKFVVENISSLSSIYALYQRIGPDEYVFYKTRDLQYLKIVADSVKTIYPGSSLVVSLVQDAARKQKQYENMVLLNKLGEKGMSGTGNIDLNIKDKDGKEIRLNSLKGKVVLLNFWASSDQASLKSNKTLQAIYNQYHAKGFEVYSVSLDNNKAAWLDAVRFDEYKWIDVCELTYPDSYAAAIYNLQSIPTNFLIDKKGNIVAKNLNGKLLGTWLDNLL